MDAKSVLLKATRILCNLNLALVIYWSCKKFEVALCDITTISYRGRVKSIHFLNA